MKNKNTRIDTIGPLFDKLLSIGMALGHWQRLVDHPISGMFSALGEAYVDDVVIERFINDCLELWAEWDSTVKQLQAPEYKPYVLEGEWGVK